eukprot:TRINITY_DN110_c0_g1_i1.p1 TRINITY_DN110_c0_g1~~TRINITY_DN110_c0_g1_i1.p1  ORF type:complete len:192 (-),score=28.40 TRINITY_DN110_c0_g1_i1:215-751(-)
MERFLFKRMLTLASRRQTPLLSLSTSVQPFSRLFSSSSHSDHHHASPQYGRHQAFDHTAHHPQVKFAYPSVLGRFLWYARYRKDIFVASLLITGFYAFSLYLTYYIGEEVFFPERNEFILPHWAHFFDGKDPSIEGYGKWRFEKDGFRIPLEPDEATKKRAASQAPVPSWNLPVWPAP